MSVTHAPASLALGAKHQRMTMYWFSLPIRLATARLASKNRCGNTEASSPLPTSESNIPVTPLASA
jgi:hypothetical protein